MEMQGDTVGVGDGSRFVATIVIGSDVQGPGDDKVIKCNAQKVDVQFNLDAADVVNYAAFHRKLLEVSRPQLPQGGGRPHVPVAAPGISAGSLLIQSNAHLVAAISQMATEDVNSFIIVLMSPKVQSRLVTRTMCFVAPPLAALFAGRDLTEEGEAPSEEEDGALSDDEADRNVTGPSGADFLRGIHAEHDARRTRTQFDADELDVRGGFAAATTPGSMTINIPGLALQTTIAVDPENARALLALDSTMSFIRIHLQPRRRGNWNSKKVIRGMIWEVLQRCVQAVRVDGGDWADELFAEEEEGEEREDVGEPVFEGETDD
jgi:hypothetical protein